ncbi:MAG: hypothetical protein ABI867_44925 [Kofleriaceae bacterium]
MRTWLVIPAAGVAAALGAFACGVGIAALAAALAGAALAHAVRRLAGDTPGALAGAALAAVLAVLAIIDLRAGGSLAVPFLAVAAMAWTIAELADSTQRVVIVALLPATVAAVLDPSCAALVAIAGTRVLRERGAPRWAIALPIAGGLVVILAVIAGSARHGALAALATHWFGRTPHAIAPAASLGRLAGALGPLAAVAALAGLAALARVRLVNVAIVACAAGALLVDLRAGAPGSTTVALAALCAGIAVGAFAGTIRIASGQAITAATCALLLVVPPAFSIAIASG